MKHAPNHKNYVRKNANQQVHVNTKKKNNDMLFFFHKKSHSIISFFIYNFMNLAISCNSFDCFCSMMIHVKLLVLNVKMNYVDHKFILSGSTQSNSQM